MLYNIDKEKTKGGLNMKAKIPYNYRIMTYIRSFDLHSELAPQCMNPGFIGTKLEYFIGVGQRII